MHWLLRDRSETRDLNRHVGWQLSQCRRWGPLRRHEFQRRQGHPRACLHACIDHIEWPPSTLESELGKDVHMDQLMRQNMIMQMGLTGAISQAKWKPVLLAQAKLGGNQYCWCLRARIEDQPM